MRRHRPLPPPDPGPAPDRVLIISASMGAGHDGAARTLAAQLRSSGYVVEVKDFLTSGPLRIGSALRSGYEFELRHVPSAYDATYRLWYRVPWLCPLVAWLVTALTRRRVMRWVTELRPKVVVSTYPLATLCLGRLRRSGRLELPAVNFITDFGVHPLWVHRGMDLNLAIHETPADVASERTSRRTVATGPAVSARFAPDRLPEREESRRRFGIAEGDRAVLIVAGSWGVGNVGATCEAIAGDGRFVPVVVCGRDEKLRRHVSAVCDRTGVRSVVLGWTDDMPGLMAGCDALVENAGGLTSLEAMRAGLPVVSFDPIAGHGRENTTRMHEAGVACLATDPGSLTTALAQLTEPGPVRDAQIDRAKAMFRLEPSEVLLTAEAGAPLSRGRRSLLSAVRLAAGGVGLTAICWTGLTTGVAMATEAGAGVAEPAATAGPVAYFGVRLTAAELADPAVDTEMRQLTATAVIDDQTAAAAPEAVRVLAAEGVGMANGGFGEPGPNGAVESDLPWNRAWRDARAGQAISSIIGTPVDVTVPGRRLNAWDLVECRNAHTSLVVPDHILHAGAPLSTPVMKLVPRQIYMVNGLDATPAELAAYLSDVEASLGQAQLAAAPLGALV